LASLPAAAQAPQPAATPEAVAPPAPAPQAVTPQPAPAAQAAEPAQATRTAPAPQALEPQSAATNVRVPRELSPWSMFMSADILVKAVMVSLAFASFVTWTILLAKSLQLFAARRRVNRDLATIAKARSLAEAQLALGQRRSVVATLLATAINEVRLSSDALLESGVKERVESRSSEILPAEGRVARIGLGTRATIGPARP